MISFEQALSDQEDLEKLCADRTLVTSELFAPNAFYGKDFILKEYANLPPEYSLKAIVPHGIVFGESYLWEDEARMPIAAVLCYSPFRKRVYATRTDKWVLQTASPFLYLLKLMKDQPVRERKGTIFFPSHSTHRITTNMDPEGLADMLVKLPEEYQPVTVCIYWKDYCLGQHVPFQRRGMRVVSAGHMFDPHFLYRFYHLCSTHHYAASNEIGTNLFYSIHSGCSFFLTERGAISYVADPKEYPDISGERPAELRLMFGTRRPTNTSEQIQLVDYYLGSKYVKTPVQLRRQLHYLEYLDRYGFFVWNKGNLPRFVTPPKYRRQGRAFPFQREWIRGKMSGIKRRVKQVVR